MIRSSKTDTNLLTTLVEYDPVSWLMMVDIVSDNISGLQEFFQSYGGGQAVYVVM